MNVTNTGDLIKRSNTISIQTERINFQKCQQILIYFYNRYDYMSNKYASIKK